MVAAGIAQLSLETLDRLKAEAIAKQQDFYRTVAAHVLGVELDKVSMPERNEAKQALFMYMYGSRLGTRIGGT